MGRWQFNTLYIVTVACLGSCSPACYGMGETAIDNCHSLSYFNNGLQLYWSARSACSNFLSCPQHSKKVAQRGFNLTAWQALDSLQNSVRQPCLFSPQELATILCSLLTDLLRTASLPNQRSSSS